MADPGHDYEFEWDPAKARSNHRKHGVSFEEGSTVFLDPRALSVYDTDHGDMEDRWVTLGLSSVGRPLVVIHTFRESSQRRSMIRMISVRKATRRESRTYGS